MGSTAIISMAEIWSVARINPSSEANAVPARPANSSAVTTGPSSLTRPMVAAVPGQPAPYEQQVVQARTMVAQDPKRVAQVVKTWVGE